MRRAAIALVVAVVALLGGAVRAAETPIPPTPVRWVTDPGGWLTPTTLADLDARLEAYDHATGRQVVVWIGPTLGGTPIEDFAAKAFKAWGLGQRGKDNGVALFLFTADRQARIEVGYGLEAVLPDAYAARILDDVLIPALAADDHDGGVTDAVAGILSRLGGEPARAVTPPRPAVVAPAPAADVSPLQIVLGALGLIGLLWLVIRHPGMALWLLWTVMGRGGGGGGGGGFSGGGGRSGGGGASGRW
jgi:uncharacterized protein